MSLGEYRELFRNREMPRLRTHKKNRGTFAVRSRYQAQPVAKKKAFAFAKASLNKFTGEGQSPSPDPPSCMRALRRAWDALTHELRSFLPGRRFAAGSTAASFESIRDTRRCVAQVSKKKAFAFAKASLRLDGFEPSTLSLKVRCSTTELKSRKNPQSLALGGLTPTGFEPVLSE